MVSSPVSPCRVTYDELLKHFGEQVMLRRRRLGMTQEALAERAHLSRNAVSEIERGRTNPSLTTICVIAIALGTSPVSLFAGLEGLATSNDVAALVKALTPAAQETARQRPPRGRVRKQEAAQTADQGQERG